MDEYKKVMRHRITVGMKDSETKKQELTSSRIQSLICTICRGYRMGYTTEFMRGGYFHEDGTFVAEESLCITLIGADDAMTESIAKDLCAFLNQETVLVTREVVDCRVIKDKV